MMNQINSFDNNDEMTGMNTFLMSQSTGINSMMDENINRIKDIIKPYEDKIKEQEEIIRKNTFQIILLKEKLKQKGKNNNNEQMNQMGMMMNSNMNNNINLDNDLIEITFQYGMNNNQNVKCLNDELIESVINRYCKKSFLNRNFLEFSFINEINNTYVTVSDLGLLNNSIIFVRDKINFGMPNNFNFFNNLNNFNNMNNFDNNFNINNLNNDNDSNIHIPDKEIINIIFSYRGDKNLIFFSSNSTLKDAFKEFIKRRQISDEDSKNLTFLFNDKKLF